MGSERPRSTTASSSSRVPAPSLRQVVLPVSEADKQRRGQIPKEDDELFNIHQLPFQDTQKPILNSSRPHHHLPKTLLRPAWSSTRNEKIPFEAGRGVGVPWAVVSELQRVELVAVVRSSRDFQGADKKRGGAAALQKTIISLLDHFNFRFFVAELSPRASASV